MRARRVPCTKPLLSGKSCSVQQWLSFITTRTASHTHNDVFTITGNTTCNTSSLTSTMQHHKSLTTTRFKSMTSSASVVNRDVILISPTYTSIRALVAPSFLLAKPSYHRVQERTIVLERSTNRNHPNQNDKGAAGHPQGYSSPS